MRMDGTDRRQHKSKEYKRRGKLVKHYSPTDVWKLVMKHKQTIATSVLLFVLLVLLFGVSSQLQPPVTNNTPSGVTVIDYSTFVNQVKAGNILAATIQGNTINGLVVHPLSAGVGRSSSPNSQPVPATAPPPTPQPCR